MAFTTSLEKCSGMPECVALTSEAVRGVGTPRAAVTIGLAVDVDSETLGLEREGLTTPHLDTASAAANPSRRSRTNSPGISSAGKWPPASGARHRTMWLNRSSAQGRGCFSMSCG